jgi:hypothetical protein
MQRPSRHRSRANGGLKKVGPRAIVFFIGVVLLASFLGFSVNERLEKSERAHAVGQESR